MTGQQSSNIGTIVLLAVQHARPDCEGQVYVSVPMSVTAAECVSVREFLEMRGNSVATSANNHINNHTSTFYVRGPDAALKFEGDPWPRGTPWSVLFAGATMCEVA